MIVCYNALIPPELPSERHNGPAEDTKDRRHGADAASNDEPVHESTNDEFAYVDKGWAIEYLPDRVEVLVLWILDKPQCACAETCPERGK